MLSISIFLRNLFFGFGSARLRCFCIHHIKINLLEHCRRIDVLHQSTAKRFSQTCKFHYFKCVFVCDYYHNHYCPVDAVCCLNKAFILIEFRVGKVCHEFVEISLYLEICVLPLNLCDRKHGYTLFPLNCSSSICQCIIDSEKNRKHINYRCYGCI